MTNHAAIYALFAIGSGASGGATSMNMLLAGRALQGLGGGGIQSLTGIIPANLVSLQERGVYAGLFELTWSLAVSIGPVVGGGLASHGQRRWLFCKSRCSYFLTYRLQRALLRTNYHSGLDGKYDHYWELGLLHTVICDEICDEIWVLLMLVLTNTHIETETSQKRKNLGSSNEQPFLRFPSLFSSDFGPSALLYAQPSLSNTMYYGEDVTNTSSRGFSIIRPTIELPLDAGENAGTRRNTVSPINHHNRGGT
ncbi:hypothetical protein BU15DRAFT_82345 [Melanogaster broomeanus]|nr:hypothetical protein BU15DRAFT_82345 [Melanogaster broomeanus]